MQPSIIPELKADAEPFRDTLKEVGEAHVIDSVDAGVLSTIQNVQGVSVEELKSGRFANIAERSGRAQDKDDGGGLEALRRDGYM